MDLIAERIRALGYAAPGSFAQYARLSVIEESQKIPSAEEMIADLVKGQEAVVRAARKDVPCSR